MDSQSFCSCQFVEDITLGSLKTPFMQNRKYFCSCAIGLSCHKKASLLEKGQALTNPKPIQSQNQFGFNPAPKQDQRKIESKASYNELIKGFKATTGGLHTCLDTVTVTMNYYRNGSC